MIVLLSKTPKAYGKPKASRAPEKSEIFWEEEEPPRKAMVWEQTEQ